MTYHIGLAKRGNTMVIEVRHSVDYLGCEIYDYMGAREVTKKHLRAHRYELLNMMKTKRPDVYGKLRYAIVN